MCDAHLHKSLICIGHPSFILIIQIKTEYFQVWLKQLIVLCFQLNFSTCTIMAWLPSVLWRCWLGGKKGIWPVKKLEWWVTGMVICLEQVADLHMAQLMPLPLTVSCFSKNQICFTFLVPAHPGSPRKRAIKWVCVCVYHYGLLQIFILKYQ